MKECAVCGNKYNDADPSTRPPACSEDCWNIWIKMVDHREEPCWIPGCLEVYCGIRTPGYCFECDVFKVEREIQKRGINKDALLWGSY